ncbi:encapsulin [Kocuria marina]|uniref:encapsulin n=1 Tax=Kocuria marina TaxID=223184 RepID=UPI00380C463A
MSDLAADTPCIQALQRRMVRVVELRAPFTVRRTDVDAVARAKTVLHLGQDAAIGYSSHTAETVNLYFWETLTFRVNTSEASVVIIR